MAQRKFLDFLDMVDGGGAGAVGNEFEGGGLLSVIANAIATPYGSEDKDRRDRRMAAHGLLDMVAPAGAGTLPRSAPQGRPQIKTDLDPFGGAGPNIAGAAAERGMGLDPFGGAGPNIAGVAAERGMGLDPFGGAGFNPANAAPVQVSPQTTNQSPMEMFGGQQPAPYESSPKMQAERFVADLSAQYPNQAQAILTSTMAQGIFDDYIRNGYQLPAL